MADNNIVLGSGELYIADFSGTIPADAEIEVVDNKIANISGGASLDSKADFKQIKDDFDISVLEYFTNEEVKFKSGILTWNLPVLDKIIANGEVDTSDVAKDVLFIGGRNKNGVKRQLIRFVHTLKKTGKKLRITLVGSASGDFKLNFEKDKETVIDAEFTAVAQDTDGTLVKIEIEK